MARPGSVSRRRVLKSGVLMAAGCAWPAWIRAEVTDAEQAWTLGNDLVQRVVAFQAGRGLYTKQITCLAMHKDYIGKGTDAAKAPAEFSFVCGGQAISSKDAGFELIEAIPDSLANGKSLTVKLRHRTAALEVAVVYRMYNGHPALRKHLALRNTGSAPLRITHLNIETLELALGPANELTLLAQYGTVPREIFYTGRSEDGGLLLANGLNGDGMAIVSEVPGYMKRTEIAGWDAPDGVRVSVMYDTDLMPFERLIAGGEAFTTAAASLVPFRRGDGFNDPQWRLPSYAAQVLERRVDAEGAPWIYNTWEPFERGINEKTAMELIEAAGAMGMDVFTIDDGWQLEYGENTVNLANFPGGLEPIIKAVEAKGMRLGLWLPIAAIGTNTEVYRKHPEWASQDMEGKTKYTGTMAGEKAVMCMASPYWEAAADRIIDAIERFRLAYVKLDLTTIFNAYGEAPGCWAKGHDHASWAESLGRIYEGIAKATAKVYGKHADVLLDLTFELWGQKHIIDAGLLAAGDLDWMSNVDDRTADAAGPRQARQLLYARAATMPVEAMLIGNMHADLPTIQEAFATAIGSAPLLCGDLRKLSAADRAWYREKIGWFKQLRRRVKLSESFFPLGSWQQTTPAAWDGFARLSRNGAGVIVLFRNKWHETTATVRIPAIAEGSYAVRSLMGKKKLGSYDRRAWTRGVAIELDGPAEVLELEPIAKTG